MKRTAWTVVIATTLAVDMVACGHQSQMQRLRKDFETEAVHGDGARAQQLEQRIFELADLDYGPEAEDTFELRADIAATYGWARQTARALAMAEADLVRLEDLHGRDDIRTLAPRLAMAWTLVAARRWTDAKAATDRVAAICHREERCPGPHADRCCTPYDDRYGRCRRELDDLYMATGDSRSANAEFLHTEATAVLRDHPQSRLSALTLIGRRYAETGDLPQARWYLRRCVDESRDEVAQPAGSRRVWSDPAADIRIDIVDSAHAFDSQAPRCLDDLIALERNTGNNRDADALAQWRTELWHRGPDLEDELKERVRRSIATWNDEALTAWDLDTLGWYYRGKDRTAEAIEAWTEASRLLDRLRASDGRERDGATAWRHVDVLLGLGGACEEAARLMEAENAYRRASVLCEAEMHPLHACRLDSLAGLAQVQSRQGAGSEAEGTWRRYIEITAVARGRQHADLARGLAGLADARQKRGYSRQARTLRAEATRIRAGYSRRMDAACNLPLPSLRSPPSPASDPPTETPAALP